MINYMLVGIAALLSVCGIILCVKGKLLEEEEAVPISDLQEIKELTSLFHGPATEKLSGPESALHLGGDLPEKAGPVRVTAAVGVPKQGPLDPALEENRRLKKELDGQIDQYAQIKRDFLNLQTENSRLSAARQDLASQVESLQDLGSQNALLARQTDEGKSRYSQLRETYQKTIAENDALKERIRESNHEIAQIRSEFASAKAECSQDLVRAKEMIQQLEAREPEVRESEFDALSQKLSAAITVMESLKLENKNLKQLNGDLKSHFKQVEDLNAHLLQKEEAVRYELTRSRAQTLGLEKICEDFKEQIEIMSSPAAKV